MSPEPGSVDRSSPKDRSIEHTQIFIKIAEEIAEPLEQAGLSYAGILVDTNNPVHTLEYANKARVYCHPLGRDGTGNLFALGGYGFKDKFSVTKPAIGKDDIQASCIALWAGTVGALKYQVLENLGDFRFQKIEPYGRFFTVYAGSHAVIAQYFNWNEHNFCLLMNTMKKETIEEHLKLIEGNPDKPNLEVMINLLSAINNANGKNPRPASGLTKG
jgi:hypothetical protein